jgi:hypothetical protein
LGAKEMTDIVPPTLVAETMKHVPAEGNGWKRKKVGMAIWACAGGSDEGAAIWTEWLQRCGKYDAAKLAKEWEAMRRNPPNHGYGKLEKMALTANPNCYDELDIKFLRMNGDFHDQHYVAYNGK